MVSRVSEIQRRATLFLAHDESIVAAAPAAHRAVRISLAVTNHRLLIWRDGLLGGDPMPVGSFRLHQVTESEVTNRHGRPHIAVTFIDGTRVQFRTKRDHVETLHQALTDGIAWAADHPELRKRDRLHLTGAGHRS